MNSYNYTTKKVKAKRRKYAPRPSYTSQDTGWSNLVVSIKDNDKIREIIDGTAKLDFVKKEITPAIKDGFWTIGEKPTYVKARADVLTYSVETISGSPIMRNAKGAITVKAHIYYNLKDITAEAMKNGIKIQWLIVNESGQSRKGVTDEEWRQKHSAEQSNTDTMTFTSDDFEKNCNTKIGFEIVN